MNIEKNVSSLRIAIDKAMVGSRENGPVTLVGVTKSVEPEVALQLINAGVNRLGENRVQEFVRKENTIAALAPGLDYRIDFIGHLQSNKINALLKTQKLGVIQSLDTLRLAENLDQRCKVSGISVDTLIEVKTSGEEAKGGFDPADMLFLIEQISQLENLHIKGLMTMAPFTEDTALIRSAFDCAWDLYQEIKRRKIPRVSMEILSMGMTGDFEIAVAAGANMVRIGRALFQ